MKKLSLPILALTFLLPITAFAGTQTFNATGADQIFTVPAGVTSISVALWGANGAGGNRNVWLSPGTGGPGGYTNGSIAVTPGQPLKIIVGIAGEVTGGSPNSVYGGGGGVSPMGSGGGGRSAIRLTNDIEIMTAGGGGGGGGGNTGGPGGGDEKYCGNTPWPNTDRCSLYPLSSEHYEGEKSPFWLTSSGGGGWYGGKSALYGSGGSGGSGYCRGAGVSNCTTRINLGSPEGSNGKIVITWTDPVCPVNSSGTHPSCVCDTGYTGNGQTGSNLVCTPNALTCTLTATLSSINTGGSSVLSWTTTGVATSFTVDQGIGAVTPVLGGSQTVTPTISTTYTGTVSKAGLPNTTCSATVIVGTACVPVTCPARYVRVGSDCVFRP